MHTFDITFEKPIPLDVAQRMLPDSPKGKPVSSHQFKRWIFRGLRTPRGMVYLEAVRIGRGIFTSKESVLRFVARMSSDGGDAAGATAVTKPRTPSGAAYARALRRLAVHGITMDPAPGRQTG